MTDPKLTHSDDIRLMLELQERVTALAPTEPDILRLLEALRLLETTLQEDLAIVLDSSRGRSILRRDFTDGKVSRIITRSYAAIKSNGYELGFMTGADTYEVLYMNFVEAVFRFASQPLPSVSATNLVAFAIAQIAPPKPDTQQLLEALRYLETTLQEDLAIVVDNSSGRTWLRRPIADGGEAARWSLGIVGGRYVCYYETTRSELEEMFPNFIAAVYAFAGRPLAPRYAAAMTQAAEKLAARR